MHPTAASGRIPAPNSSAIALAPKSPPRLKKPWQPDMMGFLKSFCTSTDCTFIVTSTVPIAAPNTSRAAAITAVVGAAASSAKIPTRIAPNTPITRRHPSRPHKIPATGIAASDPSPMHSSNNPSALSESASRSFTNGTSGAQVAVANPTTRKISQVAYR